MDVVFSSAYQHVKVDPTRGSPTQHVEVVRFVVCTLAILGKFDWTGITTLLRTTKAKFFLGYTNPEGCFSNQGQAF